MKKVVKAAFVLSAFTFVERTLGFLFKIFLSRMLGASAIGVYQVAFSFFVVLLTLITSGIPLVVSKMTAKCRAEGTTCHEGSISVAALCVGIAVSIVSAAVVLIFNKPMSRLFASPLSMTLVLLMLPSLLFSAVYSAFRGNLWGRQKYTLVSALELIEQICRIGCCLLLFAIGFDKLKATAVSMSVSCLLSAASCVLSYFLCGGKLNSPRGNLAPLIKSAVPVTMARVSTGIVSSLTAIVVPFLIMLSASSEEAMYVFGYSVGMAMPLIYVPLTFVGSISFVMIPTLSTAAAKHNDKSIAYQVERALSMSIVIGVLFFPAFRILGEPIGTFLYGNADAGKFLSSAAWLILPISVENITSSMMNSLDLEVKGLRNYVIGSLLMFGIMFASWKSFNINLLTIGMGVSLTVSSFLDIIAIRKKIKVGKNIVFAVVKNILLCYPACSVTKWTYDLTAGMHDFWRIAIGASVGFVFFVLVLFVFGSLKLEYFFSKKKEKTHKKTTKKVAKSG